MKHIGVIFCLVVLAAGPVLGRELTLNDCLEMALGKNEALVAQQKKLEGAKFRSREKNAALLPNLGLSASYYRLPYSSASKAGVLGSSLDDYTLSVALKQPLYAGGRLRSELKIANLEEMKAGDGLKKVTNDLQLDVAAAYYRARHAADILLAEKASRDHLRDFYQRSKQLSLATRLPRAEDLLQIEVQLGNAGIKVEAAGNSLRKAVRVLLDLIYSREEDAVLSDVLPEPDGKAFRGRDLLESNFDYRAALYDLAAAREAVTISRSALLPVLNLNAYTSWEWAQFPPSDNYSQWGLSLEMLLFDFFKTPFLVQQVEKTYELGAVNLDLLKRKLELAYRDRLEAMDSARTRYQLAADNLLLAERSLEIYRTRAQSYTVNSKQMLDAEQAALQAEINKLNALLEYHLNRLELDRLLGRFEP